MSTPAAPTPAPAYAQQRWGVFGMGVTGVSLARHLIAGGARVRCVDTRAEPAGRSALAALNEHIDWRCGELDAAVLLDCDSIAVSPGVPLDHPVLRAAAQREIPLVGDIELFARRAGAPCVGITGSNGKSTVTTLVWQILEAAGFAVRAGGNLGTPALELLAAPEPDYYVL
jgi:UDP-N-acetylmuramoylalanine--D-glutamate ligase